jgi:AcrR family transcriptional regulator
LTTGRTKPLRSDARRNYDKLLVAADEAFSADGVAASLEGIARAAGVAIGTLYSHFPTRDDLLATLIADRMDRLVALGAELAESGSPQQALTDWLTAFGTGAAAYQGLPDSVIRTLRNPDSALYSSCATMRATCDQLLTAAKRSGVCRDDVDAEDLLAITAAVAGAADARQKDPHPFVALITRGLRVPEDDNE